jgi:hypothetical protein
METMQFGPHDYFGVYSLAPVEQPAPYRDFKILRERPYYLFHIEQRPGFDLPPMIDGKYTKWISSFSRTLKSRLRTKPISRNLSNRVEVGRGSLSPRLTRSF